MAHIVLLGDSIFDNGAYTEGGPDVISQVRQLLPDGWHASLFAVDGATTVDVPYQVHRVPPDSTHLVLSAGGNDALECWHPGNARQFHSPGPRSIGRRFTGI